MTNSLSIAYLIFFSISVVQICQMDFVVCTKFDLSPFSSRNNRALDSGFLMFNNCKQYQFKQSNLECM